MNSEPTFPQYRKYKNNKVYFKIISASEWEEAHVSASGGITLHRFTAKILPDRNYVQDMLFAYEAHWDKIEADEYEGMSRRHR